MVLGARVPLAALSVQGGRSCFDAGAGYGGAVVYMGA